MRTYLLTGLVALIVGLSLSHAETHHLKAHKGDETLGPAMRRINADLPLTVTDVLALHNTGSATDREILHHIENFNYSFDLSSHQLAQLQKSGVSHNVIDYIVWHSDLYTFEHAHYIGRDFDPLYTPIDPRQASYADYPWHNRLYPQQSNYSGIGGRSAGRY